MNLSLSRNVPRIDHRAVQARQRTAWASGDYAVAGNALQIVSEELCETVNLCQDERVLDVAAGNFHASLAAARRWCEVTATDHASDLTNRSRQRAEAAAVGVRFVDADAEGLPFADQSFNAVISAFGAMFAADQERAASEMIRVCRRGGRVGLANWTPDGFIGQLFADGGRACAAGDLRSGAVATGAPRSGSRSCLAPTAASNRRSSAWRCAAARPMDWVDKLRAELCARAQGASRCSMPTGKRRCAATCWSWWRASIAPRTARWWWMRSTWKW